jgi:shikimate dehydrogenase
MADMPTACDAPGGDPVKPDAAARTRRPVPLYGVIGNPVAHSLGPAMHSRAFAETGQPGVYLAFRVTDLAGAVAGIRALGIRGVSVTLPHKVAVMDLLDAVDDTARRIGAVNTVVNREGTLTGTNTDWQGAVAALEDRTEIRGRRVWVLGAGGAARAVAYGMVSRGGRLTVVNRNRRKGEQLAADFNANFMPLSEVGPLACDILVNTTPVGMWPETGRSPVPLAGIAPPMVVMDIVYNPVRTLLLETAARRGCPSVDGMAMFVAQGAAQFTLWTGRPAPAGAMRRAALAALEKRA